MENVGARLAEHPYDHMARPSDAMTPLLHATMETCYHSNRIATAYQPIYFSVSLLFSRFWIIFSYLTLIYLVYQPNCIENNTIFAKILKKLSKYYKFC